MIKFRHSASRAFALLVSLTASGLLYAETITLQALDDFPSIDAGEVPYTAENVRDALQINAAVEEYRDKFARATASYTGKDAVYDLTLVTLGEIDGEGEYRVLVNDVVVGTVINDPVTIDFTEQLHTFPDIAVPAGATLSVESNAVSNGLIPENGAYAFARGRWRRLILQNDSPEATPVDLQVSTTVIDGSPQPGEDFTIRIDVANNSATDTATQPVITVTTPASITVTAPAQCTLDSDELTCALPEIGALQTQSISLLANANTSGPATLQATVSADQTDSNTSNNTSIAALEIGAIDTSPLSVDLQLAVSASTGTEALLVGDEVTYTLNIRNAHANNVATAPIAGIILPASLQYQSSADCALDGINVLCNLSELAPNEASSVAFIATAVSAGRMSLIISVSATEPDDVTSDNEIVLPVTVITTSPATPATESSTDSSNEAGGNSGGGSISILVLLAFLTRLFSRRGVIARLRKS